MSLTYLGEIFDRPATQTKDNYTTQRVFKVEATARESAISVLGVSDLPKIDEPHPDKTRLTCNSRNANPEDDGDVWIVTCSYGIDDTTYSPELGSGDPWDLPPFNVSFGTIAYNKILKKSYQNGDTQGNPTKDVLNSVENPFDPPVEYVEYNSVLRFSINKRYFDLRLVRSYQGTINKYNITVMGEPVPAKKGRINALSAKKIDVEDSDGNITYSFFQLDFEIEIGPREFKNEVLDAGFYYLDGTTRKEIKLSDAGVLGDSGEVITEPAKLDGSGGIGTDAVYLDFYGHFTKDWSNLSIPRDMGG